ncbi:MAG: lipid II flippase MurJ [Bacteroidota bacterium]
MIIIKQCTAWLKKLDRNHQEIAIGVLTVGFFVLIGKFAGAAKEVAVAWRYGVGETVDVYLFVFNLVQWPISIWAGVIGAVLVPFAIKLQHENIDALPRFRSELLGATLFLGVVLGLLAWLFFPWLVKQPWLGFKIESSKLALSMLNVLLWTIPFGFVFHLFSAWTMSSGRHLNTLLQGVPALVILVAVLFSSGPEPLVYGTLIGFVLQVLFLYVPLRWRGEAELPVFQFRSKYWVMFFAGFGMMLVGQALMSITSIVDQFFAVRLGEGALSKLGYSNRILALILGLGTTAIGRAALPVLSKVHLESRSQVSRLVMGWAGLLLFVGLGVALAGAMFSETIVELLYQRGAFKVDDTQQVAEVLRYALVQVPFYFVSIVLMQALLSRSYYTTVALVSGIALMVKIILSWLLVSEFGINGLLLATAAVYAVFVIFYSAVLVLDSNSK